MKMHNWLRKALTQTVRVKSGKATKTEEVPPSERLILIVEFSIASIAALTTLQIVHLLVLGAWNPEVFAAITGLIGTVSGILIGSKT